MAIHGGAQGLYLPLCSGISICSAQVTIWHTKDQTMLASYKAKALTTVLFLQPWAIYFTEFKI